MRLQYRARGLAGVMIAMSLDLKLTNPRTTTFASIPMRDKCVFVRVYSVPVRVCELSRVV